MGQMGYWIDLGGFKYSDDEVTWIQALPLGKYQHPVYGEVEITPERVVRMANNIQQNVRETDLDIDYDHKEYSGKAAGWVKGAEAKPDGLWIGISWTDEAKEALRKREYRYFSPEFSDEWKHPKTGTVYQDVLFGGAITNRPFLKDILPINMSELFADVGAVKPEQEENKVDPKLKAVLEALGLLSDDVKTDEDGQAKLKELGLKFSEGKTAKLESKKEDPKPETDPELVQLSEKNPAIKQLMDRLAKTENDNAILMAANKAAAVDGAVSRLTDPKQGRKFSVPPAVREPLKNVLLNAPAKLTEDLSKVFDIITEHGLVELGEVGGPRVPEGDSAIIRFHAAVEEKMKADKDLEYGDAAQLVATEDPMLFTEYREESYAGEV